MKKRMLSTVLALVMCLGLLPAVSLDGVQAAAVTDIPLTWTEENGEITITGIDPTFPTPAEPITELVLPDTIKGKPVTAIGDHAFCFLYTNVHKKLLENLRALVLPKYLKIIDTNAFEGAGAGLSYEDIVDFELVIPSGVIYIGKNAFRNNLFITSLRLDGNGPGLVLGTRSFIYCGNLKTIKAERVSVIEDKAFFCCNGIADITFSNRLREIGSYGLASGADNTAMTGVHLPATLEVLGAHAFDRRTGLESVIFDGSRSTWKTFGDYVHLAQRNVEIICRQEGGRKITLNPVGEAQGTDTPCPRYLFTDDEGYLGNDLYKYGIVTPESGKQFRGWLLPDGQQATGSYHFTSDLTLNAKMGTATDNDASFGFSIPEDKNQRKEYKAGSGTITWEPRIVDGSLTDVKVIMNNAEIWGAGVPALDMWNINVPVTLEIIGNNNIFAYTLSGYSTTLIESDQPLALTGSGTLKGITEDTIIYTPQLDILSDMTGNVEIYGGTIDTDTIRYHGEIYFDLTGETKLPLGFSIAPCINERKMFKITEGGKPTCKTKLTRLQLGNASSEFIKEKGELNDYLDLTDPANWPRGVRYDHETQTLYLNNVHLEGPLFANGTLIVDVTGDCSITNSRTDMLDLSLQMYMAPLIIEGDCGIFFCGTGSMALESDGQSVSSTASSGDSIYIDRGLQFRMRSGDMGCMSVDNMEIREKTDGTMVLYRVYNDTSIDVNAEGEIFQHLASSHTSRENPFRITAKTPARLKYMVDGINNMHLPNVTVSDTNVVRAEGNSLVPVGTGITKVTLECPKYIQNGIQINASNRLEIWVQVYEPFAEVSEAEGNNLRVTVNPENMGGHLIAAGYNSFGKMSVLGTAQIAAGSGIVNVKIPGIGDAAVIRLFLVNEDGTAQCTSVRWDANSVK